MLMESFSEETRAQLKSSVFQLMEPNQESIPLQNQDELGAFHCRTRLNWERSTAIPR